MVIFIYIFAVVVLLGLCIFVHELGHLLGGKLVGIKAEIFSIGYGKGVLKKKIGETTYQVTLIPFGGYCKFYGDEPGEKRTGRDYEFLSASPYRKIVTVAMGPIFNLFFGIFLFFIMNLVGYSEESSRISIMPNSVNSMEVNEFSAAYQAGLRSGDRIIRIDNKEIKSFSDIQTKVFFSKGQEIEISVSREGVEHNFKVTPAYLKDEGHYSLGVIPYGQNVVVANLLKDKIASQAGFKKMDQILAVDGKSVENPDDFIDYISSHPDRRVIVSVFREGVVKNLSLTPELVDTIVLKSFGKEKIELNDINLLKQLINQGKVNLNSRLVSNYDSFVKLIKNNKGRSSLLEIDKEKFQGEINLNRKGQIGVYLGIVPEMVEVQYKLPEAFIQSLVEPYEFIMMQLKGMGMLFTGQINLRENLGGPVKIGKIAGDVLYERGWADFILLMAKISIILMIMNFLPIPVVDGGHLVFFLIEIIRGKPLSDQVMAKIQTAGVIFLITLGVLVIFNDISMLPFFKNW